MARSTYSPDDLGTEVVAPWGYYQPLEVGSLDHAGRQVLYTLGSACIEASCCGKGSWNYARVEGYVVEGAAVQTGGPGQGVEVDTIESVQDRAAIAGLVMQKHPGIRVEFR